MRTLLVAALIPLLALSAAGCARGKKTAKDYNKQLAPGEIGLREVDIATLPNLSLDAKGRDAVRQAIRNSQAYLAKPSSDKAYPIANLTKQDVSRSLAAMEAILASSSDDATLNQQIKSRFRAFMSVGCDDQGTVLFTGYYTPIFAGSRTKQGTYQYPLYKRPADLQMTTSLEIATQKQANGSTRPYPAAAELEQSGSLKGQELVWLADPYEAYLIRVQGSGNIRLADGTTMEVGYNGTNGHPYKGIGQDLVKDGKIPKEKLSFFSMREYFRAHPEEVAVYTQRNPRFIFFTEVKGGPFGSLGQPVTTDVSIATDKSVFPPAGPVFVSTTTIEQQQYNGLRVDQDTGGGIRAAGRCDLYMGVGEANEHRAGAQYFEGKMYYLIAKE